MNDNSQECQQPSVLASKSLTILEDLMNGESLSIKKFNIFANSCSEPSLKSLCERANKMHRNHFETLYGYLTAHNKAQG